MSNTFPFEPFVGLPVRILENFAASDSVTLNFCEDVIRDKYHPYTKGLKIVLAGNRSTPPEILVSFSHELDLLVQDNASTNSSLPVERIIELSEDLIYEDYIISNYSAPGFVVESAWKKLKGQTDIPTGEALLSNKNTPRYILEELLSKHGEEIYPYMFAGSEVYIPDWLFDQMEKEYKELVIGHNESLFLGVVQNPNLSDDQMQKAIALRDQEIDIALALNPVLDPDLLMQLLVDNMNNEDFLFHIASNPSLSTEMMEKIYDIAVERDVTSNILRYFLNRENCPTRLYELDFKLNMFDVPSTIRNGNFPVEKLVSLLKEIPEFSASTGRGLSIEDLVYYRDDFPVSEFLNKMESCGEAMRIEIQTILATDIRPNGRLKQIAEYYDSQDEHEVKFSEIPVIWLPRILGWDI